LDDFRDGHGCPKCSGCAKPTLEFLRFLFDQRGYDLRSATYVNARSPLIFWCRKCQAERQITWMAFRQGQGCKKCGYARRSQQANERRRANEIRRIKQYLTDIKAD
jgi:hypothetical protein